MLDVASERERRREEARLRLAGGRARFPANVADRPAWRSGPPPNPIARAYFRAIEPAPVSDLELMRPRPEVTFAEVIELLADASMLAQQAPRGLLNAAPDEPARVTWPRLHAADAIRVRARSGRLWRAERRAGLSREHADRRMLDPVAAVRRKGSSRCCGRRVQPRVRKYPHLPDDYLVAHDLIGIFQIGWTALYKDVVIHAAHALMDNPLACAKRRRRDSERAQHAADSDEEAGESRDAVARRTGARRDRDPRQAGVGGARAR